MISLILLGFGMTYGMTADFFMLNVFDCYLLHTYDVALKQIDMQLNLKKIAAPCNSHEEYTSKSGILDFNMTGTCHDCYQYNLIES